MLELQILETSFDLWCGDCLELMPKIPDGGVNLILCDLPYGSTNCKWDSIIPFEPLWAQYKRILKSNGVVVLFASQPFTSALVMSNPKMYKHEWIWKKDRGSNFANTVREPMKEHESLVVFSNGKWTYNKQMQERAESGKSRAKYDFSNEVTTNIYNTFSRDGRREVGPLRVPSSVQTFKRETGFHPTQKPVALCEYIIRTYTNEGDMVLDNCMGSGTVGVGCRNLSRNFIGIELDQTYFDIACKRINE